MDAQKRQSVQLLKPRLLSMTGLRRQVNDVMCCAEKWWLMSNLLEATQGDPLLMCLAAYEYLCRSDICPHTEAAMSGRWGILE